MGDMEHETFIEDLKKKSCARIADHSQTLEDLNKEELEIIKGLDLIQGLDVQLKEIEERHKNVTRSTSTNSQTQSPTLKKSSEQAENLVRLERTNQLRACKLRLFESLDQNQHESSTGFILRNIKLGPNSRYFMLKPEEEAIVERLLQESNQEEENGSVSSSQYDMGFEMSETDAHRLAQIDDELFQYQNTCGPSSSSIICSDISTPKAENDSRTTTTQSKHVRLCCKTIAQQDKMESVIGDYLNERRYCREYQLQSEAVDKKLRDLQISDLPKVTTEEITALLNQCKCEQGMLSDPLASHYREGHYSVHKVPVV